VVLYVFGDTGIFNDASEEKNETHLTRESEMQLLNNDLEGQTQLQVLHTRNS